MVVDVDANLANIAAKMVCNDRKLYCNAAMMYSNAAEMVCFAAKQYCFWGLEGGRAGLNLDYRLHSIGRPTSRRCAPEAWG